MSCTWKKVRKGEGEPGNEATRRKMFYFWRRSHPPLSMCPMMRPMAFSGGDIFQPQLQKTVICIPFTIPSLPLPIYNRECVRNFDTVKSDEFQVEFGTVLQVSATCMILPHKLQYMESVYQATSCWCPSPCAYELAYNNIIIIKKILFAPLLICNRIINSTSLLHRLQVQWQLLLD